MRKWIAFTTIGVVPVCFFVYVLLFWPQSKPAQIAQNVVTDIPTERMQIDVVTFKSQAKKRMRLPTSVQTDPEKHVTAATRVEVKEDRPVEVTAVVDARTGETTLYEREVERPLFDLRKRTEAGVFVGLDDRGGQVLRFEARHEFARLTALHAGVVASADVRSGGDVRHYLGIGLWGAW